MTDSTSKNINIFLVGPMGAGKTTVGRQLARKLGKSFHDLDETLQQRTGVDIARIFELEAEAGFRTREAALLDEISSLHNIVLATGGGSVLETGNRALLRGRGLVIYLRTPVAMQLERLQRDKARPLLQTPDRRARLEALMAERQPLYLEVADLVVDSEPVRPQIMAEKILVMVREANNYPLPQEGGRERSERGDASSDET